MGFGKSYKGVLYGGNGDFWCQKCLICAGWGGQKSPIDIICMDFGDNCVELYKNCIIMEGVIACGVRN